MRTITKIVGILLIVLIITGGLLLVTTGSIPFPSFLTGGTSASTTSGSTSSASTSTATSVTISTLTGGGATTTTTSGNSPNIQGLKDALAGNAGLNNFLTARDCGLTDIGYVQFCDTFPDASLNSKKWIFYGVLTVSPGKVVFDNATMRSVPGFYYGHFGTFQVEITPQPPRSPVNGACPPGWPPALSIHGQIQCIDYAVFGFARGTSANAISWGIYFEQNGTQIRAHTRYANFLTKIQLDTVSTYVPIPGGVTEYAINWDVDSHGAFADFYYKTHNGPIIQLAHITSAIPKTFLYLFAASNGTHFVLHRIILLPSWRTGPIPLASLAVRLNEFP